MEFIHIITCMYIIYYGSMQLDIQLFWRFFFFLFKSGCQSNELIYICSTLAVMQHAIYKVTRDSSYKIGSGVTGTIFVS